MFLVLKLHAQFVLDKKNGIVKTRGSAIFFSLKTSGERYVDTVLRLTVSYFKYASANFKT